MAQGPEDFVIKVTPIKQDADFDIKPELRVTGIEKAEAVRHIIDLVETGDVRAELEGTKGFADKERLRGDARKAVIDEARDPGKLEDMVKHYRAATSDRTR